MNCASCQHQNPDDSAFCEACGSALEAVCASCGASASAGASFCRKCGSSLAAPSPAEPPPPALERSPRDYTPAHLAERILQSKSAMEGERKQVSVLFADVKGSMELAEGLDPEAWHRILDRFFQILSEGVHRFEGTINQYTGDGIMALFGAPIAHEDHAQRACFAALHLRDAVRQYANEVRVEHGVSFGVRIGIHSGEVVVGKIGDDLRMDYTAQGHVVGLAQRIEALAESGHACLSEQTARLVEGYFQLEDLGPVRIKGVSEPVGVFDLEGVGPFRTRLDRSRARGLSSFVGRSDEMTTVESALEHAMQGQSRLVGVVADAGVGKSRLCFEFVERCRARGVAVHEAHCPAHGRSVPLLPILELFRGYFGIGELDTPQAAREKVAGRLLLLDRDFESYLPLVWDFLRVPDPERPVAELDAETRQQLLSEVMRQVARARSERSPVVLLIDDLHWIDTASDAFLAQLIESLRGTRTLLLMNFRPEYRADWMQQRDYLQLPLTPLGSDAIRDLVTQLLGADESVAKLPAAIEARTAGNPFFTEEVVQTLIESGQLQGERGSFRLVRPVENLEIPESVHSVLAARIDRLPELDKHVLQTASVVGKNFPRPLLGQIANLPDAELDTALRRLCEAEFLYERSLYPIAEYAFKHPLTHEVAYGSPLAETRRGVHRALASALEQEELPNASLLAHHWDEADAPEPAVRWHKIAAEETGFSDPEATKRHWQRASELLTRLPESAQNLIARSNVLAEILWVEMRLNPQRERAHSLYTQSIAAAEHAGDLASLARARFAYSNFLLYSGQTGSLELARRAVDEADRSGDRAVRICTRWALAINAFFTGRAEEAFQAASEGIELSQGDLFLGREIVGYSPYLFLKGVRAGANALLGRFDAAQIDLADSLSEHGAAHRTLRAVVEPFGALIHSLSGDRRAALAHANASLEAFSATAGTAAGEVWVHYSLGLAHIDDGQPQRAIELLEHSMRVAREADSFLQAIPQALILCARAHLALANPEAAEAALEEALTIAEALSDPLALALGRLTCAELELTRAQPDLLAAEREVTAAAKLMTANQLIGHFPRTHLHRAAICRAARDEAGWRSELETAGSLYREIGATHHIEAIEARLTDYAGASGV